MSKKKHKQKPVKQFKVEICEERLNSTITSDNRGLSMLAETGFKQGVRLDAIQTATSLNQIK